MCPAAQLSADYTSQSASYEKAKSHEAELAHQLATAQERCEALRAECEARTAALEGAQMRLRRRWRLRPRPASSGKPSCRPLRWALPRQWAWSLSALLEPMEGRHA